MTDIFCSRSSSVCTFFLSLSAAFFIIHCNCGPEEEEDPVLPPPPMWTDEAVLSADWVGPAGLLLRWKGFEEGAEEFLVLKDNEPLLEVESVRFAEIGNLSSDTDYIFSVQALAPDGQWSLDGPSLDIRTLALPPDPIDIAEAFPSGSALSFAESLRFLYEAEPPVIEGLDPEILNQQFVSVLRGRVMDSEGDPLPGVRVSISGRSEYGKTYTRSDGIFDLVVNGGSPVVVEYEMPGRLPAQRRIRAPVRNYTWLPDVILVRRSVKVVNIDLSAPGLKAARAESVEDTDGKRQALVLFPEDANPSLRFKNGEKREVRGNIRFRATEYTVGEGGPLAMPAELPSQIAYTYAIELSLDETMDEGAGDVIFERPVIFHVDNFLDFPVGSPVPIGYYDAERSAWTASENGRIIAVTGINADGLAGIDISGDGRAEDAELLHELGIDEDERRVLGETYEPGQSLWRVALPHFSAWDCNWPFGPPEDARPPGLDDPETEAPDDDCEQPGSVIECFNQTLKKSLELVGMPFNLHYRSDRVPGHASGRIMDIPLSGEDLPESLKRIDLEVYAAGRKFEYSYPAEENLRHVFEWDGKDVYGRRVPGAVEGVARVGWVYDGVYHMPGDGSDTGFGRFGETEISGSRTREEITLWQTFTRVLHGRFPDMGGWTPGVHHRYDPAAQILYYGTGEKKSAGSLPRQVEIMAGRGTSAAATQFPEAEGGPATEAYLRPRAVAVGPEGSVYLAEERAIRRVWPDGRITTVIESGRETGEGPEGVSEIGRIDTIAVDARGLLYLSDRDNAVIWRINERGEIEWIAGSGMEPSGRDEEWRNEDGRDAKRVSLHRINDLAFDAEERLWLISGRDIRRIENNGTIANIFSDRGGVAIEIAEDGTVYFADTRRVYAINTGGEIIHVAGSGSTAPVGDGGPAISAGLDTISGLAIARDGNLYVSEYNGGRIRQILPDGRIFTYAGLPPGESPYSHLLTGSARRTQWSGVQDITLDHEGYLIGVQTGYARRVGSAMPGFASGRIIVPSSDAGRIYEFTGAGRHVSTMHALTGAVLWSFGYDEKGRLISLTDGDGNETLIERDDEGSVFAITGPFGQSTYLEWDEEGYLSSATNPAGEERNYVHSPGGLLVMEIDPRGNPWQYAYDELGRLILAEDPLSGQKSLERTDTENGFEVTYQTPLGRTTKYRIEKVKEKDGEFERRRIIFPDGSETRVEKIEDQTKITTTDGTTIEIQYGPDPRFGMLAPVFAERTVESGGHVVTRSASLTSQSDNPSDPLDFTSLTYTDTVNNRTTTTTYTSSNQGYETTSPERRRKYLNIDDKGRAIEFGITDIEPYYLSYDDFGRLSTLSQGTEENARMLVFSYNAEGYINSYMDSLENTVSFDYDAAGRMTRQSLPDGGNMDFSYDENGNLTGITPPGRPVHTFSYDARNLVTSYTPPQVTGAGSGSTTYAYNPDNQITRIGRPDGLELDFVYDAGGRLSTLGVPSGEYSYAYNSKGQLSEITDPEGSGYLFEYNNSLLTQVEVNGPVPGITGYDYDEEFRLNRISVNGTDVVVYEYDNDSLLIQAGEMSLERDRSNGLLTGTSLSGVTESYTYNEFGQVETRIARYNGIELSAVHYSYDRLARIIRKVETIEGTSTTYDYAYDAAGRLVEVLKNGNLRAAYTYDGNGNRLSITGPDISASGTYDDQDRLISWNGTTFEYTANGELLRRIDETGITAYDYDVLGNLRGVNLSDGREIGYMIDAQGRRVGRKVDGHIDQAFLYQGHLQPIAELDENGDVITYFVYALNINSPDYMVRGGETYRLLKDYQGSVRMVVNVETGELVQRIDYDEFGRVLMDTNPGFQPFGFAGGLYDPDTGLVRFGARDYDPEVGRWTAKDPILFEGGDTNLYVYVLNDPINWIDPLGLLTPSQRQSIINNWTAAGAAAGAMLGFLGGGGSGLLTGPGAIAASPAGAYAGAAGGAILGGALGAGIGSLIVNLMEGTNGESDSCEKRNPAHDKKLSKDQIKKLKDAGYDIHEIKPRKHGSRFDLFIDKQGNIYIKPKSGIGPGEPTGININFL